MGLHSHLIYFWPWFEGPRGLSITKAHIISLFNRDSFACGRYYSHVCNGRRVRSVDSGSTIDGNGAASSHERFRNAVYKQRVAMES